MGALCGSAPSNFLQIASTIGTDVTCGVFGARLDKVFMNARLLVLSVSGVVSGVAVVCVAAFYITCVLYVSLFFYVLCLTCFPELG